jgi:hypothetical protein
VFIEDVAVLQGRLSNSGSSSFNFSIDNLVTSSVPEPTSLALTLVGLAAVGATAARKRK